MSSENRTPIPVIRDAIQAARKQSDAELNFAANQFQERVKARFYRRMDEMSHIVDKETVLSDPHMIVDLAGTERVLDWFRKPGFAVWFLDSEYMADTIASAQSDALRVVQQVLYSEDATEGDRLKAARMLFELGDMFPGRKSEVRFLDDRLNNMSDKEVDDEMARLTKQLSAMETEISLPVSVESEDEQ